MYIAPHRVRVCYATSEARACACVCARARAYAYAADGFAYLHENDTSQQFNKYKHSKLLNYRFNQISHIHFTQFSK